MPALPGEGRPRATGSTVPSTQKEDTQKRRASSPTRCCGTGGLTRRGGPGQAGSARAGGPPQVPFLSRSGGLLSKRNAANLRFPAAPHSCRSHAVPAPCTSSSQRSRNKTGARPTIRRQSLFCVFRIENSARIRRGKRRNASFPVWVLKKSWKQLCGIYSEAPATVIP